MTKKDKLLFSTPSTVYVVYEGDVKNGKPHGSGEFSFYANEKINDLVKNGVPIGKYGEPNDRKVYDLLQVGKGADYHQKLSKSVFGSEKDWREIMDGTFEDSYSFSNDETYINSFLTFREVWYKGTFNEGEWDGIFYRHNYIPFLKDGLGDWNEIVSGHVYIPFRTYEKSREPLRVEKFKFKKDVMVYGVLNLEGGHYKGEVKDLKPHGFGTHTSIDGGEKIKGRWQEGELVADEEDLAIEEENFYEDYE